MEDCFIGLGSNLGERRQNINLAVSLLEQDPGIKIRKISSLIETAPQDCTPQPKFLNGVVKISTDYSAQRLLSKLQEIEVKLGRANPHPKNQPRTIDLDILTFGDLKTNETNLKIPHPRMWQRDFVTIPLKEIAPEMFSVVRGQNARYFQHKGDAGLG